MKKKLTWMVCMALVAVLAFAMMGFAPVMDEAGGVVEGDDVFIGVLLKTRANPYWVTMEEGINEQVGQIDGVEVEVLAAESESDIAGQLSIMENMINSGKYDALAVAPITPNNLITGVVLANEKGLPVVNIDEKFDMDALTEAGGYVVGYATSDNIAVGEAGAGLIIEALGADGGGVAIVEGQVGATSGELRRDGCVQGLEGAENIEVLDIQPGDWDRQKSLDVATNLINKYGDELKAIFTANDTMALGVLQAMENTGRTDIYLVSTDANDEVKEGIKEGKLVAVVQDSGSIGTQCVIMAANAARTGNAGSVDEIPADVLIPATVVTQENVEA